MAVTVTTSSVSSASWLSEGSSEDKLVTEKARTKASKEKIDFLIYIPQLKINSDHYEGIHII